MSNIYSLLNNTNNEQNNALLSTSVELIDDFSHDRKANWADYEEDLSESSKVKKEKELCKDDNKDHGCLDLNCLKKHTKPRFCKFYITKGFCKNEDKCPFIHEKIVLGKEADLKKIAEILEKKQKENQYKRDEEYKRKCSLNICRNVLNYGIGKCKVLNCPFEHNISPLILRDARKDTKCPFGEKCNKPPGQCEFSHLHLIKDDKVKEFAEKSCCQNQKDDKVKTVVAIMPTTKQSSILQNYNSLNTKSVSFKKPQVSVDDEIKEIRESGRFNDGPKTLFTTSFAKLIIAKNGDIESIKQYIKHRLYVQSDSRDDLLQACVMWSMNEVLPVFYESLTNKPTIAISTFKKVNFPNWKLVADESSYKGKFNLVAQKILQQKGFKRTEENVLKALKVILGNFEVNLQTIFKKDLEMNRQIVYSFFENMRNSIKESNDLRNVLTYWLTCLTKLHDLELKVSSKKATDVEVLKDVKQNFKWSLYASYEKVKEIFVVIYAKGLNIKDLIDKLSLWKENCDIDLCDLDDLYEKDYESFYDTIDLCFENLKDYSNLKGFKEEYNRLIDTKVSELCSSIENISSNIFSMFSTQATTNDKNVMSIFGKFIIFEDGKIKNESVIFKGLLKSIAEGNTFNLDIDKDIESLNKVKKDNTIVRFLNFFKLVIESMNFEINVNVKTFVNRFVDFSLNPENYEEAYDSHDEVLIGNYYRVSYVAAKLSYLMQKKENSILIKGMSDKDLNSARLDKLKETKRSHQKSFEKNLKNFATKKGEEANEYIKSIDKNDQDYCKVVLKEELLKYEGSVKLLIEFYLNCFEEL